jgi:hypothetical protein
VFVRPAQPTSIQRTIFAGYRQKASPLSIPGFARLERSIIKKWSSDRRARGISKFRRSSKMGEHFTFHGWNSLFHCGAKIFPDDDPKEVRLAKHPKQTCTAEMDGYYIDKNVIDWAKRHSTR